MIEHPIFGTIDPSAPDYREGSLVIEGRDVPVDLTLPEGGVNDRVLGDALDNLENVPELDVAGRDAIARDAQGDEEAPTVIYIDHHLEELEDAELEALVGNHDREHIQPSALLARLKLVRLSLYPGQRGRQLVLEYSLGPALTEFALCVAFDVSGEACAVELDF